MLAELPSAAQSRVGHMRESSTHTESRKPADSNREPRHDDHNQRSDNHVGLTRMTSSETPTRFLKLVRASSVIAHDFDGTASFETIGSDTSNSDSRRCNNANLPNKITGEMGLQIFPSQDGENEIVLKYCRDRHFQYIHPHIFAPASLSNAQRMGGGGSGITVFSGTHPELGDIVMKHGGFSDLKELFALATISAELTKRESHSTSASCPNAARSMKSCLPEFKMVYISPQHVLFKPKAVWGKLSKLIRIGGDKRSKGSFASLIKMKETSSKDNSLKGSLPQLLSPSPTLESLNDSKFLGEGASIRIYECDDGNAAVYLDNKTRTQKPPLVFVVPKNRIKSIQSATMKVHCSEQFNSLRDLYDGLSPLMSKHLFKFTLAQKRIGGPNAKTGSQWMYEGKLDGLVLDKLISKFVVAIHNLQALTLPEEVDVVDKVRAEVKALKDSDVKSDGLSIMADQFMGNAIKKNFNPTKGRIHFLRRTCQEFGDKKIFLTPEEAIPAKFLTSLAEPDALMSDVFIGSSSEPPLFHPNKDLWINLMIQAVSDRKCMSPNATKRVWTSGLSDAGIHNLFVNEEDLYFFDLGVPQLQSLPGFMTKFLFSFFHVLGMQEDENNDNEWVRRFVPQGGKLALTKETIKLLPKAYDAFDISLSRIINEIFDGDQGLRWLLTQYVTLQLLSDASFCLQRWKIKGGGRVRDDNHNKGLERWLWRALWDVHVAFDINTIESWQRLQVEHPSCNSSSSVIENAIRISIRNSNPECCFDSMEFEEATNKINEEVIKNHDVTSGKYLANIDFSGSISSSSRLCRSSPRGLLKSLNHHSLRELTASTFEFKISDQTTEESSESEYEHSETSDDSAILPMGLRLVEGMVQHERLDFLTEEKGE